MITAVLIRCKYWLPHIRVSYHVFTLYVSTMCLNKNKNRHMHCILQSSN